MTNTRYITPTPDQCPELDALLGAALHFPPNEMAQWLTIIGLEHVRAIQRDQRLVAGIAAIPMAQYFGGKPVATAGVTAVGVAPDLRGTGVGSLMMRESLNDLHSQGYALASLYPASLAFYRRAGYERAGYRITYELPLTLIDTQDQRCELVPCEPDEPVLRELYAERARRSNGNMQRPEWMWRYRLNPEGKAAFRYLIQHQGQNEGYIAYTVAGRRDPLQIIDLVVLTPAAGRRVLTLLNNYHSILDNVIWTGGPLDPLLYLLPENLTGGSHARALIKSSYDWMLRIVNVSKAIEARGYPHALNTTLEIELSDHILSANAGRYTLEIADGSAHVTRGGAGRIMLDVRTLAAIYTGFATPQECSALGQINGPELDLARMAAVFSGPRPWLADMF